MKKKKKKKKKKRKKEMIIIRHLSYQLIFIIFFSEVYLNFSTSCVKTTVKLRGDAHWPEQIRTKVASDSHQSVHLCSLIRIFAFNKKKLWIIG